jgi:hypothetical protein
MTRDIAILGIAAIGVGFTIITAGIDLRRIDGGFGASWPPIS